MSGFSRPLPGTGPLIAETGDAPQTRFARGCVSTMLEAEAHHPTPSRALVKHDRYPSPCGRSEIPLFGPSHFGQGIAHEKRLSPVWLVLRTTSRDSKSGAGKRPADLECSKTGIDPCKNYSLLVLLQVFLLWPLVAKRILSAAFRVQRLAFLAPNSWAEAPFPERFSGVLPASFATIFRRRFATSGSRVTRELEYAARALCLGGFWHVRMPIGGQ